MSEATKIMFSYKEIVVALIKQQGIHDGIWSLMVEFGLGAANAGPDDNELAPSAIVPVQKIGIHKVDSLTNLSVDAAVENPGPKKQLRKSGLTIP
jgi:hypothetical protein